MNIQELPHNFDFAIIVTNHRIMKNFRLVLAFLSVTLCSINVADASEDSMLDLSNANDSANGNVDEVDGSFESIEDEIDDTQGSNLKQPGGKRGLRTTQKKKRRKGEYDEHYSEDDGYPNEEKDRYRVKRKINFLYAKNWKYPGYIHPDEDGKYHKNNNHSEDKKHKYKHDSDGNGHDYEYDRDPYGKVVVTAEGRGKYPTLKLYWKMENLDYKCKLGPSDALNSCGVHIHKNLGGYSACKHENVIGGHKYKYSFDEDPWVESTYYADENGASRGVNYVKSGLDLFENKSCVVVFHNREGKRMSCGVLRGHYH